MPIFEQTVYVDVDLDQFDEDEIVEHLKYSGYTVTKDPMQEVDYVDIAWQVNCGNLKEALILLERKIPELKGIANLN